MASILDSVDQRTQLAGRNRLELLLFRLGGKQRFGINVFKVQEVLPCPVMTRLPKSHPVVSGVAHVRGRTFPVLDLALAIGAGPLTTTEPRFVVITEYNRSVQGFLVSAVDRIVNLRWEDVRPPPRGAGGEASFLTAVTQVDEDLVEIIDVERVLTDVVGVPAPVSALMAEAPRDVAVTQAHVLAVDDSLVARRQIRRTLEQIGVECTLADNGRLALELLRGWADAQDPRFQRTVMVVSDIEMPEMDGYTLTTELRSDPRLQHLYVLLHTSLSGVFNSAMVEKVGANRFLAKFQPDELADVVLNRIHDASARDSAA
ncbi:MAG: chemotaxis protein CheW [Chromatiales bacterium 21-64-14]|nr:MAG: chemotaxis protein CheW [Chromatiales bacterium 21-64-14]HQU15110.1 chemotaxis protein CheV [Gammaproteobacteria bacterium]